jgi:hypothetical protein
MTPRRILLAGWLVFMLHGYPGYLDGAAADELFDARVGAFMDWHSPMLSEVWRIVGIVISGPAGMLVVQSLLLLLGSFQLLRRGLGERGAAIGGVCVLLFPEALATSTSICVDAQLASFLVGGTALLLAERRWPRVCGLGLLLVACGLAEGTAFAALPLVVVAFRWVETRGGWQRYVISTGAWLAIALLALALNGLFIDGRTHKREIAFAMGDIVGTLRYAPTIDDARARALLADVPLASTTDIQNHARQLYGLPLYYAATDKRLFEVPQSDSQYEALRAARRAVIRAQPGAYVAHRWHVFVHGFAAAKPAWLIPSLFAARQLEHNASSSWIQTLLTRAFGLIAPGACSNPLIYLIVAVVLLPLALVRRQRDAAMVLASALAYEVALMFTTSMVEPRMGHWLMIATVLAAALLIGDQLARRTRISTDVPNGIGTRDSS